MWEIIEFLIKDSLPTNVSSKFHCRKFQFKLSITVCLLYAWSNKYKHITPKSRKWTIWCKTSQNAENIKHLKNEKFRLSSQWRTEFTTEPSQEVFRIDRSVAAVDDTLVSVAQYYAHQTVHVRMILLRYWKESETWALQWRRFKSQKWNWENIFCLWPFFTRLYSSQCTFWSFSDMPNLIVIPVFFSPLSTWY